MSQRAQTLSRPFVPALSPEPDFYRWQRALYFRPWFISTSVVELGLTDGLSLNYASIFATNAIGFDADAQRVQTAQQNFPRANFACSELTQVDLTQADVAIAMDMARFDDPMVALTMLAKCPGKLIIGIPDAGHEDEWIDGIQQAFEHRGVKFLHQEEAWPGRIKEGLRADAHLTLAIIGADALPVWPRIGLSMPTHKQSERACEAIVSLINFYPGELQVAVVANGTPSEGLARLRGLQSEIPGHMILIEESKNLGYGLGSNRGLDALWQDSWFDFFGVVNDDVMATFDCVSQLVAAMQELEAAGQKPGIIGPMSNEVNGPQRIDLGTYTNPSELMLLAEIHLRQNHSTATQNMQVRGLFILIHPDCLNDIGGFDPAYGLGNFEDDDMNLRARLAGYSLWVADGAFLHHAGSCTFRDLEIDYNGNIIRNLAVFLEKWGLESFEESFALEASPINPGLFVALTAQMRHSSHQITINGEPVDLVYQASEFDLAAWIVTILRDKPRESRAAVLDALMAA